MPETDVHAPKVSDEQREVDMRRYQEAFDAGLSHEEASAFAFNGEDIGVLRAAVKAGCDSRLVARLVA